MRVGQNRRRDKNEQAIVDALEAVGVLVWRISAPGLPDLLTYRSGVWMPLEIKRTRARRSLSDRKGRSLTPAQCATYAKAPFPIVTSIHEAYLAVGLVRRELTRARG